MAPTPPRHAPHPPSHQEQRRMSGNMQRTPPPSYTGHNGKLSLWVLIKLSHHEIVYESLFVWYI